MQRIDVHQHLLSEALIEQLARRRRPPMLIRRGGGWTFRVSGEPDSVLSFDATNVALRAVEIRRDDVDRALVALSTVLGIETLPGEEAVPLLEAHHRGVEELPAGFGGWGAVQLEAPDPAEVDAVRGRGCVGVSLPATALAHPDGLAHVGPLLAALESHGAPLFVHPGPVAPEAGPVRPVPVWWPALTDYVAQMQAAWFAFLHGGRREHPRLRVLFAMLAGGAPLQLERFVARGGTDPLAPDPLVYYDTSSYGPRMLEAMANAVGFTQLVYGSDRPVVDPFPPQLGPQLGRLLHSTNPHSLLTPRQKGDLAWPQG
ncbi:MAG TPA: amidohydrolase family protein [Solirubrobacterales bacterium]|nr:amidohydrolase family protein [Solirubrobacterales bacterium]